MPGTKPALCWCAWVCQQSTPHGVLYLSKKRAAFSTLLSVLSHRDEQTAFPVLALPESELRV